MNNIARKYLPLPKLRYGIYYSGRTAGQNCFARPNKNKEGITWMGCRERFHPMFNKKGSSDEGLYYGTSDVKSAAKMFQFVEDLLGLKDTCRSTLYRCRGGKHIFVELSPFWLSLRLRTAFVTIMLRASAIAKLGRGEYNYVLVNQYSRTDATIAKSQSIKPLTKLMTIKYCTSTPRATAMFLDGYTRLSTRHAAWVRSMGNPKKTKILVRPKRKKDLIYFKGDEVITRLTLSQKRRLLNWVNKWELKKIRKGNLPPTDPIYTIRRGEEIAFNYKG